MTVNQSSNPIYLYLNGSQQNLTATYGDTTNATAYISFGSVSLFRNGEPVSTPDIQELGAGTYIYTANSSGDSNHTANSTVLNVTILQAGSTTSLFLNSSQDNLTQTYGESINATAYCDYGSPSLYLNSSSVSNPYLATLAAEYYNFTAYCPGDSNHSSSSKTFFLTVNKATTQIYLTVTPTSPTAYPTQINATCSASNPEVTANLYRNNSQINSENGMNVTLAAGTYNFTCNSSATGNYTPAYNQTLHEITRAPMPLLLYLNSSQSSQSYSYGETSNATGYKSYPEGSLTLLRNGSDYGNPEITELPAGYWNYTLVFAQTQNYSANSTTLFATVTSGASVTTVYLNSSSSDQAITYGETINATAFTNYGSVTFYLNGSSISNPYIGTLGAGYWNLTAYSTGDANHSASEDTAFLTVNQSSNPIYLYLNGSQSNLTVTYGNTTNASAYISFGSVSLFRNNSAVSNPDIQSLGAGTFIYTANSSGDSNHTSNSTYLGLAVNKAASTTSLFLNSSQDNLTQTYGDTINATAYCDYGTPTLYLNTSALSIPYIGTLTAGYWNFTAYCPGDSSHSSSSKTFFLTVNQASNPIFLYLNGSQSNLTVTYGNTTNASAYISFGSVSLFRNSQPVSTPDIQNLGAGTYIYTANSSGDSNHTTNSTVLNITVLQISSVTSLFLNSSQDNLTQTYGETINASAYCDYGSPSLYLNSSSVSNPYLATLAAAYYNFTAYCPGDSNHSSSSKTVLPHR